MDRIALFQLEEPGNTNGLVPSNLTASAISLDAVTQLDKALFPSTTEHKKMTAPAPRCTTSYFAVMQKQGFVLLVSVVQRFQQHLSLYFLLHILMGEASFEMFVICWQNVKNFGKSC